ncbi:MAG: response regulator [Gemmatimonadota bacterium]
MTERGRVLVVDDSATAREIYGAFLRHAGYAVVEAADGLEALERIAADRPDVMVLDVVLPRMDGLEVMRRAREAAAGLPIICVTAAMSDDYRRRARRLDCAAFVEKPDSPRRIVDVVRAVLEGAVMAGGDEPER